MKSENLGFLNLPKIGGTSHKQFNNYYTRLWSVYRPALQDLALKEMIVSRLEKDDRVLSMQGNWLNFGCGPEAFDFDRFAMWFLWMMNEHGEQVALDALNIYLDSDYIYLQENLWVSGFRINKEIIIDDCIKMLPISLMPDSECKEVFSAWPPNFITREHELPEVCIVASYKTPKFLLNEDSRCEERINQIRRIRKVSELINLFDGIYSFSYRLESSLSFDMPYGVFHTPNGSWSQNDILGLNYNAPVEFSGGDINELLLAYEALSNDLKAIVDMAISRLSQVKRRKNINDKLLDLGIVLDSLLVLKNEGFIKKNISERGGTVATKRGWDFNVAEGLLRNIYELRSDVAHDGFIDSIKLRPFNNISEEIRLIEDILKELIFSQNFYWR